MQKYALLITTIFSMLYVISCSKTDDTKPFFDLTAPASGEAYQTGDSINFQAIFYDNEALGQYRIEVKSNFGEQQTALTPWQAIYVYDLIELEETVQEYISIPDTIPSGWYLFLVKAVDAKGNESYADTTPLFIQNMGDITPPVIDITSPSDSTIYSTSDSIIFSFQVSDNLKLYRYVETISKENTTIQLHSEINDNPANPHNFYLVLHINDTLTGWFKLSISASDSMNNSAFAERKFLIQ